MFRRIAVCNQVTERNGSFRLQDFHHAHFEVFKVNGNSEACVSYERLVGIVDNIRGINIANGG
jgi:hypothetical protein